MAENSISEWIDERSMRGNYFFTLRDAENSFSQIKSSSVAVSLSRLVSSKRVVSPWHGFYIIVPTEYRLKRSVPPPFYIDQLMHYLSRNYYVSLLSAANIHGAGHQQPQTFYINVNGLPLRNGIKAGTKLVFCTRQNIIEDEIIKVKTQTSMMRVSSPALTAFDLVFQEHDVGGLSRVAEVLSELADKITFNRQTILSFPQRISQRLGYLLDAIEEHELADRLHEIVSSLWKHPRYALLNPSLTAKDRTLGKDAKWRIIINQELELDEI